MDSTSSASKGRRSSVVIRLATSTRNFSSLMPDHVCKGKENRSTVKTSAVDGCIPMHWPSLQRHKLLGFLWHKGTNTSTPCSLLPPVVTVPEINVTGFSLPTFRCFTSIWLQQFPLEERQPVNISAPWQQTRAPSADNISSSPTFAMVSQHDLSESNHLITCLKSAVDRICSSTSAWNFEALKCYNCLFIWFSSTSLWLCKWHVYQIQEQNHFPLKWKSK